MTIAIELGNSTRTAFINLFRRTFFDEPSERRLRFIASVSGWDRLSASTKHWQESELAIGERSSRCRGEPISTVIIIELEGEDHSDRALYARHAIVHAINTVAMFDMLLHNIYKMNRFPASSVLAKQTIQAP